MSLCHHTLDFRIIPIIKSYRYNIFKEQLTMPLSLPEEKKEDIIVSEF